MGQPTFIPMNERILGHASGTGPADFAGADDIITNLAKESQNLGSRSSNAFSNPVLIY